MENDIQKENELLKKRLAAAKEFFTDVMKMREMQQKYFETHAVGYKTEAMKYEKKVDNKIEAAKQKAVQLNIGI